MARSKQLVTVLVSAGLVGTLGLYIGKPALFSEPVPLLEKVGLTLWPEQSAAGSAGQQKGSAAMARGGPQGAKGMRGGAGRAVLVRATNVVMGESDAFVKAIGTAKAIRKTDLYPESSGRVAEINVKGGDRVSKGDILLSLDDTEEVLALRKAEVELQDAIDQVERYKKLIKTNTISTVQLSQAELAQQQAVVAVEQAKLNLQRRSVLAPFDGILGIIDVEIGDYVTQSSRIAGLDDRSQLLVEFVVPERFSNKVKIGDKVELRTEAVAGQTFVGHLSQIDNRLDPVSRTLKMRATIDNPQDLLRAGLAFDVNVVLEGESRPAVPAMGVKWDNDGSFVWLAREGKAQRVPVTIIERGATYILVEGDVMPGEVIITEAVRGLRQGATVKVMREPGLPLDVTPDKRMAPETAPAISGAKPQQAPNAQSASTAG
ncbi:efflux RND transporter periplasmic adaptor subunit [Rhodobacteraceae bacterium RKSG542]|uniref:efflux RND transporter periplasmic adaptor subunit n=1 Tax=Pseudovibrio flavus TaxID=2529854 RepID=UPI0012BC42ED|nr:efflux RND transporter periplasmic adaptor subunit [Pseudovibrio flavus]MTI16714.1 efflux RND transporter periplasmic adaptor subunit [Pseudovibrio flavus]